jgi:peptide/nickel transport system substrate-binding protein
MCGTSATLDISGIQKYNAIYDTLTRPSIKDGVLVYTPWLAKTITHSDDYKDWKIVVRSGIKFQDGTPLTGKAVLDNLEGYWKKSTLFSFVLQNINAITLDPADPTQMTLDITMTNPWVAFDAYLWGSGRIGIMAEAQLNSKECNRTPIGTGPFQFSVFDKKNPTPSQIRSNIDANWKSYESMKLVRNPNYWYDAPDGKPYPYVDSIEFRPMPEATQKRFALQSGEVNIAHFSGADDQKALVEFKQAGTANYVKTNKYSELAFIQTNDTIPPFNDQRVRSAFQYGVKRSDINTIINQDEFIEANSPFAPGVIGHLPGNEAGWPDYNPTKAKQLLADYLASPEGKKAYPSGHMTLTLDLTPDTGVIQIGQLLQEKAKAFGVDIKLNPVEQVNLINKAIGKKYQVMVFRNWPGGDPDVDYVWWYCGDVSQIDAQDKKDYPDFKVANKIPINPVNFSGYCDPAISQALDQGRATPREETKKVEDIYQSISKRFAEKGWVQLAWYQTWAIGFAPNVHNIYGPDLPNGGKPFPGLATGHPLLGIWMDKS